MLKQVLVTPFKNRDRDTITKTEFIYTVSRDSGWFSPKEANKLIEAGEKKDFLKIEDDSITIQFKYSDTDTPEEIPEIEELVREKNAFETVLDELTDKGLEKQEIVAEINRKHHELGIDINAVALLVASQKGIEVHELAKQELEELKN